MDDSKLIWKENSRTQLLKTPIFTVSQADCTSPEDQNGNYIIVSPRDWVCIIPDLGQSFLMVKQWRHGYHGLSIEFPGGVIDEGEEPLEAAVRELKEETGCTAENMIYLGSCSPNPAFQENKMHYFLAQGLFKTQNQELDHDEYLDAFEVSKNEVFEKMGTDGYPHSLMIAALHYYTRYITGLPQ